MRVSFGDGGDALGWADREIGGGADEFAQYGGGGDAAQRGDLHQLGACNIYKAASPMVTDAWCLSSCKAGSCPKDLCEKRPTPTDICHTPPSPLMQNTSLELLDVRHTGLEPRPS